MKRQIIGTTAATLAFLGCVTSLDLQPVQAGIGSTLARGATTNYEERPDAMVGFIIFLGLGILSAVGNVIVNKK